MAGEDKGSGEETEKEGEEEVLVEVRPSRKLFIYHYVGALAFLVAGLLHFFGFYSIPQVISLRFFDPGLFLEVFCFTSTSVLLASPEIRRRSVKYTITGSDVWEEFGYFNKRSINLPLVKMERCDLKRTVTERALNIGDVKVDTGEDFFFLEGLSDPERIRELIVDRMEISAREGTSAAVHE